MAKPTRQRNNLPTVMIKNQETTTAATDKRLFNVVELRLFRYTAVLLSVIIFTTLIGVAVWATGLAFKLFSTLLLSLALAGILALVLHPVVKFLERRIHLPHLPATIVVVTVFFVSIGSLVFLFVPTVVGQIVQLVTVLPERVASWQEHFSYYFPELTAIISDRLESSSDEQSQSVVPGVANPAITIMSYLSLLAGLSFAPLFLFFALLSGNALRDKATELLSVFRKSTQQKTLYFMDVFVQYVTAFFQGQLIVAVCMGVLYATSFTLVGVEFGIVIGLVLGLLNIVPFLGTVLGLLIVLPMAYLQPDGGGTLVALVALVFAGVQLVESWLLTPKIMSDRAGLHPALVVISLFFWGTALGGVIGVMLAVPLTAFFVAIWGEIKSSLEHALSSKEDCH